MAKICPTCGSGNGDASKFCTTCGARLPDAPTPDTEERPAAAPGSTDETQAQPLATPPGADETQASTPGPAPLAATGPLPYVSDEPTGGTGGPGRFIIPIAGVIVLLLLAGAAFAAWQYTHRHNSAASTHPATATTPVKTTPRPTGPPATAGTGTPAASPAASPTVAPTAVVVPNARSYSTGTFTIQVPRDWKERTLANSIIADTPDGTLELVVESTNAPAPTTPMAQLNVLETTISRTYPNVQPCSRESRTTVDGVTGIDVLLCYTDKTRTGADQQRTEESWFGTNAGGTIVYHYGLVASHANYQSMAAKARPSIGSIHWNLR